LSTFVDGQLSPKIYRDVTRFLQSFQILNLLNQRKYFGALSRWTKTISKPTHLFCYEQGTEAKNLKARRFLELHEIIQKYVSEPKSE